MKHDFSEKVVLISGGTSGIGLAAARQFVESGASVVLLGRNAQRGSTAVDSLSGVGQKSVFIAGDVSKILDCGRVVAETVARFGRLDVLVNSAGEYLEKSLLDTSETEFDRIMSINMKGAFLLTQAATPHLKQSRGSVVNVSSDAGVNGNVFCTAYCASKGALNLFTKALSLELAPHGVRVNCVCPGDVATPLLDRQIAAEPDPERYRSEMTGMYPLGRIATADEVAAVIVFLASDAAAFVTGAAWSVDGGLTAG